MVAEESSLNARSLPLGPVLWSFIVFKCLGILLNVAFIVLLVFWALPTVSSLEGGRFVPQLLTEGLLPLVEIVATIFGIMLVVRRATNMRKFWITFLLFYCLVQVVEVVVGLETSGALVFLSSGLAWLGYWTMAKRPRELQLSSFWVTRE